MLCSLLCTNTLVSPNTAYSIPHILCKNRLYRKISLSAALSWENPPLCWRIVLWLLLFYHILDRFSSFFLLFSTFFAFFIELTLFYVIRLSFFPIIRTVSVALSVESAHTLCMRRCCTWVYHVHGEAGVPAGRVCSFSIRAPARQFSAP